MKRHNVPIILVEFLRNNCSLNQKISCPLSTCPYKKGNYYGIIELQNALLIETNEIKRNFHLTEKAKSVFVIVNANEAVIQPAFTYCEIMFYSSSGHPAGIPPA